MGKQMILFFFCLTLSVEGASKYSFLDALERRIDWIPESAPLLPYEAPRLTVDLNPFYDQFAGDGVVNIYLGFGKDAYTASRGSQMFSMLQELAKFHNLQISDWVLSADGHHLSFSDVEGEIDYQIDIGHERNEFQKAFSKYEVVMYHGHSRYGRGPAFDEYWNYFRMGDVFATIEVDVRNTYFLNEPMQLTSQYPPQPITLNGVQYPYQYQGQKVESSYLPKEAYVKNIPGRDKDLKAASYLNNKQIFYFYSCNNANYWKNPLRKKFPDPDYKMVFGTKDLGYWGTKPSAVFVMSLVRWVSNSNDIVKELNETKDCKDCFVAY